MSSKRKQSNIDAALLSKLVSRLLRSWSWRIVAPVVRQVLNLRARLTRRKPVGRLIVPAGYAVRVSAGVLPEEWHKLRKPHELEKLLWSGYETESLQALSDGLYSRDVDPNWRGEAAWVLARWYFSHCEYQDALDHAVLMRVADISCAWSPRQALLEADCLCRTGRSAQARELLGRVVKLCEPRPDFWLMFANTLVEQEGGGLKRLEFLNRVYGKDFSRLSLRDSQLPLSLENLAGESVGTVEGGPLVSVLMPLFDGERTLGIALDGLLNQSWRNLEVIIVDDCSTDQSVAVAESFARQDSRIQVFCQETNGGAYRARLKALGLARGEYIMVHDADDWSHPQKIETQVRALERDRHMVANMSAWCRVNEKLYVNRIGAISSGTCLRRNESSLMFRRELIDEIGIWDDVRVGADTEYIWRIQTRYGRKSVQELHPDVPLSFSLHREDSLTRSGATHVRTIFHGPRRVYREAQKWWHKTAHADQLKYDCRKEGRPFYCPPSLLDKVPVRRKYDLVVTGDFGPLVSCEDELERWIQALSGTGYRIALFHWHRFELRAMRPVKDIYQAMAAEGQLDILATGEQLDARLAIVIDPLVARHHLERVPDWQIKNGLAVFSTALLDEGETVDELCLASMSENVKKVLGVNPVWLPHEYSDLEYLTGELGIARVSRTLLAEQRLEGLVAGMLAQSELERMS